MIASKRPVRFPAHLGHSPQCYLHQDGRPTEGLDEDPRSGHSEQDMQRRAGDEMFEIREDDLSGDQTRSLLALHLAGMHDTSPPDNVFALDITGLQAPEITVWTAWRDGHIASVGAIKMLADDGAEVKSMRTHPEFLRQGAAAALLDTIINIARNRGVSRLSLETGSGAAFEPALALYRRRGFTNGAAFGEYQATAFNQFLHLDL